MTDKTAATPTNDLTEIAVVLDRSGSMSSIKDDMEGGLWATITEQNGLPGRCRVSLYQFDTEWETVFEAKPSGDVCREDCMLTPRSQTALFDGLLPARQIAVGLCVARAQFADRARAESDQIHARLRRVSHEVSP